MTDPAAPLPATMRAVRAREPGGPEALKTERVAVPAPGPNDVLIKVAAAGVNRPDVFQRLGLYAPPPGVSDVLGLEVSGHIVQCGDAVTGLSPGDPVCALLSGGGYAEYALADAGAVLPVPAGVALRDAAGLPETVFTVWANVFEAGRLQAGETFLVHGGASGIGVTAIQMAAAAGARVFATAGGDEKCAACEALGAERAVNYHSADFTTVLKDAGGADVVLDMVGGDYVGRNLSIMRAGGRLVMIAFLRGSRVEVDLIRLMLKGLTLTGSTLRNRSDAEKARLAGQVRQAVWPMIEAGKLSPVIDSVMALEDAGLAHARMEASAHTGKILLDPSLPPHSAA